MMLPIRVGRNVSPSESARSDLEKATAVTGNYANSGTELGPCQVLRDVRFWALLFAFGVTIGADIGTTHTFSGVVQSRYQEKIIGSLGAIVFSSTDAFTRFASGVAMSAGITPTKLLICSPILMSLGQLFMAASTSNVCFLVACALFGFSDGIGWTVVPLLTGKLFGLRSSATNFGLVVLGAAFFIMVVNPLFVSSVVRNHIQPGETVCYGRACYSLSQRVIAGLGLIATLAAVYVDVASNRASKTQP